MSKDFAQRFIDLRRLGFASHFASQAVAKLGMSSRIPPLRVLAKNLTVKIDS